MMIQRPPRLFKDREGLYILGEGRKIRRRRKEPTMQTYSGHHEKADIDKARIRDILAHEELKRKVKEDIELRGHGDDSYMDGEGKFRNGPAPAWRETMSQQGSKKIKSIVVVRIPVNSKIQKLISFFSRGAVQKNLEQLKQKFGGTTYDQLYHLGINVELEDVTLKIEKLDFPAISVVEGTEQGESMSVIGEMDLTLDEFIEKANTKVPEERLWHYLADVANCQIFVKDLLQSNDLWNSRIETFVMQDAMALLNVNPIGRAAILAVPAMKEALSVLLQGQGSVPTEFLTSALPLAILGDGRAKRRIKKSKHLVKNVIQIMINNHSLHRKVRRRKPRVKGMLLMKPKTSEPEPQTYSGRKEVSDDTLYYQAMIRRLNKELVDKKLKIEEPPNNAALAAERRKAIAQKAMDDNLELQRGEETKLKQQKIWEDTQKQISRIIPNSPTPFPIPNFDNKNSFLTPLQRNPGDKVFNTAFVPSFYTPEERESHFLPRDISRMFTIPTHNAFEDRTPRKDRNPAPSKEIKEGEQHLTKKTSGRGNVNMDGLDEEEIAGIIKRNHISDKAPVYVIAADEFDTILPHVNHDTDHVCIIVNNQKRNQNLSFKHWTAFFISRDDSVCYFDPLVGRPKPIMIKGVKAIVAKMGCETYLKVKVNRVKVQSDRTGDCGSFAIWFISRMLKGMTFSEATLYKKNDTSEVTLGEQEVHQFADGWI